jgi:hypothetical protein
MKNFIIIAFQFVFITSFGQWNKSDKSPLPLPLAVNDKLEFDAFYSWDQVGNTFYCWTDFRNGKGELYAQKLNKFGVAQWQKNGVKVGEVVGSVNYSLTKKSIIGLKNGNVAIAWHQIGNSSNPNLKNIFINQVTPEGKTIFPSGEKVVTESLINSDVNEAILTLLENTIGELKLVYSLYQGTGKDPIYLKNIDVTAKPATLLSNAPSLGSRVDFDANNQRIIIMEKQSDASDLKVGSYSTDGQVIIANKDFLNNPFTGTSRFDDFYIQDGRIIIGRTLTGSGQRRVIAQILDENLNNLWNSGQVALGTGNGFDIHTTLNKDGGGSVAWIEPNSTTKRMMAARFDNNGRKMWEKPVFNGIEGANYFSPNKFTTDGNSGFYNLWFTPKSTGFDLSVQHIDQDGNQVWGKAGLSIKDFNWYGTFRLLPHVDKGLIVLYSGTKNTDINANDTYDMFTNYISPEGTFGIEQKLQASLDKNMYCTGEKILANLVSGTYKAHLKVSNENIELAIGDKFNEFELPVNLVNKNYEIVFTNQDNLSSDPIYFSIISLVKPKLTANKFAKCVETDEVISIIGTCEIGALKWSSTEMTVSELMVSPNQNTKYGAICQQLSCQNSELTEISIEVLKVNATASNTGSYFEGQTIQLSAVGGDSYTWSGPNNFVSSLQNPKIENSKITDAGNYKVLVSSSIGCVSNATTAVDVKKILSTENSGLGFKIYPNPAQEVLKYASSIKIKSVSVITPTGIEMKLYFNKTDRIIKVSQLQTGLYILKVQHEDNTLSFARFMKE